MNKLTKTLAGVATLAVSAGVLLAVGGAANAASPIPPWEPDPAATGTITFYDAAGNVLTGGTDINDAPFFAYAVGSTAVRESDRQGVIDMFTPVVGSPPSAFSGDQISSFTNYPVTGAPADIAALQTADPGTPVITGSAGDFSLSGYTTEIPNTATSANPTYQNLYQVRLRTANSGGTQTNTYDDADIMVNTTAGTWTQVYPTPAAAKTSSSVALTTSENPATVGDNVTLTATVTPTATAGSVQFMDGATAVGAAVPVTSTNNVVSTSTTTLAQGTHSLTAVFSPTDTTDFTGSTSNTVSEVVNPAAPKTTTTLGVTGTTPTGTAATLTATVDDTTSGTGVDAGSVSFYDNGSTTALGTVAGSSNTTPGQYVLSIPAGFAAGSHSIVAKFTPTVTTAHAASQSAPQTFITQAQQAAACQQTGSQCVDVQSIEGNIPVGTIVIQTPYSSQNPLNLGTLALNTSATEFTASAPFADIKVIDNRSGDLPWTVTAESSDLTDGGTNPGSTIDSQNVGLTNLVNVPGVGFTGTVGTTNNPAAQPAVAPAATGSFGLGVTPHTVATANHGLGTDDLNGLLTLNAPTSTEAGEFTGTITFQVG